MGAAQSLCPAAGHHVASQLPLPTALPWGAVQDLCEDPCATETAQWNAGSSAV